MSLSTTLHATLHKAFRLTLFSGIITCASTVAHADTFLGIYADANYWHYSGDVSFAQAGTANQDFVFDDKSTPMVSLALEHGVPFLPNIKVKHTRLDNSKTQNASLVLDGVTYSTDATVTFDSSLTDVIAYYELLDNVISIDVGVAAKIIDGSVLVSDTTNRAKEDINATVPALYAAAGGSLPLTGLSAKAEISGISYGNNALIDAQAEMKYDIIDNAALDVGIKAGYRMLNIEIDDVLKTNAKSTFKGPYVGLEAHF